MPAKAKKETLWKRREVRDMSVGERDLVELSIRDCIWKRKRRGMLVKRDWVARRTVRRSWRT